eukprot:gene1230-1553_t
MKAKNHQVILFIDNCQGHNDTYELFGFGKRKPKPTPSPTPTPPPNVIDPEDYHLSRFASLVYLPENNTGEVRYFGFPGKKCVGFEILTDAVPSNRFLIAYSYELKRVIVAFKGSSTMGDTITDFSILLTNCEFNGVKCGMVHSGFYKAYKVIQPMLDIYLKGIKEPFDLYFTGHSLGGALVELAMVDFMYRSDDQKKRYSSIVAVTFGQPAVGIQQYVDIVKEPLLKLPYRRYVNVNDLLSDPITQALNALPIFFQITPPIKLKCHEFWCSLNPLNLHSLDLYSEGLLLNQLNRYEYEACSADCSFTYDRLIDFSTIPFIPQDRPLFCPTSSHSKLYAEVNPGLNVLSVCLFYTKDQFLRYQRARNSCNLVPPISDPKSVILMDRITRKTVIEKELISNTSYIVIENHNIFGFPEMLTKYTFNFTNTLKNPDPPTDLKGNFVSITSPKGERLFNITLTWNAPTSILKSNDSSATVKYKVILTPYEGDNLVYTYTEPMSETSIEKHIDLIPESIYSITVRTVIELESNPSNMVVLSIYAKPKDTDTPTPSPSLSISPSLSPSLSPSPSLSISPSLSPSLSPSPSLSISPSLSPSLSPSHSLSISPSLSPSLSPSPTLSLSP